jgi:hypothetical protein
MKFSNKAGCKAAGMEDLIHAAKQGGLLNFSVAGVSYDIDESLTEVNNKAGKLKQRLSQASSEDETNHKNHFRIFASLFFCFGLAAFLKTATTETRERRNIAKSSEQLIAVPEVEEDFKATKSIQRKILKKMMKSFDSAKVKLIYYSDDGKTYTLNEKESKKSESGEDDVETFTTVDNDPQESGEAVKKFDIPPAVIKSKKSFVSKFFKKISATASSAENSTLAARSLESRANDTSLGNDVLHVAASLPTGSDARPEEERMTHDEPNPSLLAHRTAAFQLLSEEDSIPFDEKSYRNQVV